MPTVPAVGSPRDGRVAQRAVDDFAADDVVEGHPDISRTGVDDIAYLRDHVRAPQNQRFNGSPGAPVVSRPIESQPVHRPACAPSDESRFASRVVRCNTSDLLRLLRLLRA